MTDAALLLIGMMAGAAIALAGLLLGARLVWRASGHEGPIVTAPTVPKTDQEATE